MFSKCYSEKNDTRSQHYTFSSVIYRCCVEITSPNRDSDSAVRHFISNPTRKFLGTGLKVPVSIFLIVVPISVVPISVVVPL